MSFGRHRRQVAAPAKTTNAMLVGMGKTRESVYDALTAIKRGHMQPRTRKRAPNCVCDLPCNHHHHPVRRSSRGCVDRLSTRNAIVPGAHAQPQPVCLTGSTFRMSFGFGVFIRRTGKSRNGSRAPRHKEEDGGTATANESETALQTHPLVTDLVRRLAMSSSTT